MGRKSQVVRGTGMKLTILVRGMYHNDKFHLIKENMILYI